MGVKTFISIFGPFNLRDGTVERLLWPPGVIQNDAIRQLRRSEKRHPTNGGRAEIGGNVRKWISVAGKLNNKNGTCGNFHMQTCLFCNVFQAFLTGKL